MSDVERKMFYAMAFYVCIDSLAKVLLFIERFIPEAGR